MSVGLGNRPPDLRADTPASGDGPKVAPLGDRVLACLATWVRDDGTVVEPTTADIAARLHITAETYLRDELNHVLTALRQRRLLKYEHDPRTGVMRWRLTAEGWSLARRLRTGVTGFERFQTADHSRDRFARVRERLDPR